MSNQKPFEVKVCRNKYGQKIKVLDSENYHYRFHLGNGIFARWGKTQDEDPVRSPFGPEILDAEITVGCKGIGKNNHLCKYCYKANTPNNIDYMNLETFKKMFEKINVNNTITQVALGLDSRAELNPDLWAICAYLRSKDVIPNGTIADVSDETAYQIAMTWGACSVSFHNDWEAFTNTVYRLSEYKKEKRSTLNAVNVHFMIAEETFDDCIELFHRYKTDPMLSGIGSIVLLSLKKCGRGETGFTCLSENRFYQLVETALDYDIQIGFDSCGANKFERALKRYSERLIKDGKIENEVTEWYNTLLSLVEPCESFATFSSYVNIKGEYAPCSFMEHLSEWKDNGIMNVLYCNNFVDDIWNSERMLKLHELSVSKKRECLFYEI